ncbi:uncharacterized protein LOC113773356 [Coffea eugenioides]|uniref:uncharacterized protein LOC113773356 n=1 Tax=Coffea eugenioides TaxID=49369 RepID=UPI000F606A62|nr:uncharacterized protein LOC113773356 [Coffea eugenioides]
MAVAVVNAAASSLALSSQSPASFLPSVPFFLFPLSSTSCLYPSESRRYSSFVTSRKRVLSGLHVAANNQISETSDDSFEDAEDYEMEEANTETVVYSFSPVPLLFVAALPGAATVRSLFEPFVELLKSWNLPDWLVHWGHPGNMAVVLFAMGGYGTYLGFRIRVSDDVEEKAKAKDLHPKLLGGMFIFFALDAAGGITSLLTSDKPIFESPHAVTGIIGLALLTLQSILPALFEGNPGLRNLHGILGSGIMTLFLVHAAFGLQLGLSY